ncbi:MAG: FliG C-terminal domain-containing protein [Pirellulales bacterium]|nr:FliG C-terminal domain-containing protein [Pirellulales bacterium]
MVVANMMPGPSFRRRKPLAACLLLAAALLITAAMAFHDWWDALPAGRAATYVGRAVCAECHRKETDLWAGSDHDLAMDHATPDTVLGDFGDARFTHVAFDDLVKLSDEHLGELVRSVPPGPWSIALSGAGESLQRRVLALMDEETRRRVVEQTARLGPIRPCDATDAHQEIGEAARRLGRQGRIAVDFAVTSRMERQGDRFYVTTDNRHGRPERFQVKYVFGVRPLQQYLAEFPDGRIQCLPIAWDTERKRW